MVFNRTQFQTKAIKCVQIWFPAQKDGDRLTNGERARVGAGKGARIRVGLEKGLGLGLGLAKGLG